MGSQKSWFCKLSIATVFFGMVVISAVMICGEPARPHPTGMVDDWSFHHLVFSNPGTQEQALARRTHSKWVKLQYDTRFIIQQMRRSAGVKPLTDRGIAEAREPWKVPLRMRPKAPPKKGSINKDWSEPLILGGQVQPNMYPALYGASPTSASCSGDFIVFPTGSAGATGAASIIAYYELYSSCASSPSVYWAYNTNGGTISNSPILYTDGVQVAFVQVSSGNVASLEVLKGVKAATAPTVTTPTQLTPTTQAASGCTTTSGSTAVKCTTASFTSAADQYAPITGTNIPGGATIATVSSGTQITLSTNATGNTTTGTATITAFNSGFVAPQNYRSCTAPCMTSISLHGSPNDTYSAPFYDFTNNDLYVGDDSGKLHQFTGVFTGTPTENTTSPWPVVLNASYKVTSPVEDPNSGYIFAGNTDGILYELGSGTEGKTSGIVYGTSSSLGNAIMDAPLVDPNAEMVYVFVTGNSAENNAVFQFSPGFTSGYGNGSPTGTEVGSGGTAGSEYYLYAGTFDNVYFESSSSAIPSGDLYVIGGTGATTGATLYQIPITSNVMNEYATSAVTGLNTDEEPWPSPLTEFCNNGTGSCGLNAGGTTTTSGIDYLFFSLYSSNVGGCITGTGCLLAYNISNPAAVTLSGTGLGPITAQLTPGCWVTSGIVIDNSDTTTAGASQVYFMNLSGNSPGGPLHSDYTSTDCTNNTDTNTIAAIQAEQFSPSGTNPAPILAGLAPSTAYAGTATQTLTIFGTNFLPNSTVTYNGIAHAPTSVGTSELTIMLSATDLNPVGPYPVLVPVVVTNPGPESSNTMDFTVTSSTIVNTVNLSAPSLTFSQPFLVASPAQTVTFTNTGNIKSTISSLAVTGTNASDFSLTTTGTSCPYSGGSLPAGNSCTISVTFFPTTTASESASVTFTAGSPQTVTLSGTGVASGNQLMTLDSTKHYLVNTFTGKPVYANGEDAWSLINQLDNADAQTYLSTRSAQGFNLIWVASADNYYQSAQPPPDNYYGYPPFDGADFTDFDTNFWSHVDYILQLAAKYGITVALDPAFVGISTPGGYLSKYSNSSCPTLTTYGNFLGSRYANYNNVIWALGGDADPYTVAYSKLNCLAAGIAQDDTNHLMTLEACPQGACGATLSSTAEDWTSANVGTTPTTMNVNWIYNQYQSVQAACQANYAATWTAGPPIIGETWYENDYSLTHPQIREEGYWGVLSGCTLGYIFGNDPIWCFNSTYDSGACYNTVTWQSQLTSNGSLTQQWMGALMRSREFWKMVPDSSNTYLTGGYGSGTTISVLSRTNDGQTMIAYIPNGNSTSITVNMAGITSSTSTVRGWWFNPSTAVTTDLGTFSNSGSQTFTPPDSNDWVLVLDDNSAGLPPPGSANL